MREYKNKEPLTDREKLQSMRYIHKRWKAHDAQKRILQAIYRDGYSRVFIEAGRKFGKNELANYLTWRTSIEKDFAESYIIGVTAEDERKIIWNNERIQRFGGPGFKVGIHNKDMIVKFPWGSFIQVDGSLNVKSGRGREFDMCIMDEWKDHKRAYYDAAYPNLLSKGGVLVIIGTPPREDEDACEHFIELADHAMVSKEWAYFNFTSHENTKLPGGADWLRQERKAYYGRGEGHLWEQEYEAKRIDKREGTIFPMFSTDFHVRPLKVCVSELQRGFAQGSVELFTLADPGQDVFCVLFCAYNKVSSQIFVLGEIYETDRYKTSAVPMWAATQEKKQALLPDIPLSQWDDIYDEAESWYEAEIVSFYGDSIRKTNKLKGQGKLMHLSLLKDAMSVPRCFNITPECLYTAKELKKFRDKNKNEKNHAIDCLRYFIEAASYEFQVTDERLVVNKSDMRNQKRAFTVEQDMAADGIQSDPLARLDDLDGFNVEDYGYLFGM